MRNNDIVSVVVASLIASSAVGQTVTIKTERTIDIKGHVVDGVARLLCEAERKDCYLDQRCSSAPVAGVVTCSAVGITGDPWVWTTYRERATTMIREMFK